MNPLSVEIRIWDSIENSDKTLRVTELLAPTVPGGATYRVVYPPPLVAGVPGRRGVGPGHSLVDVEDQPDQDLEKM